jgi:hypothetical protein
MLLLAIIAGAAMSNDFYAIREKTQTKVVTVDSSATESAYLRDTFTFVTRGFNYLRFRLIVWAPEDSLPGQGLNDSIKLKWQRFLEGQWLEVDSVLGNVAADTLAVVVLKAAGDTLLFDSVRLIVELWDTVSDTTATISYPYEALVYLKRQ